MGFNTVAFLLNDYMYTLQQSPRSLAWLLAHPPHSSDHRSRHREHGWDVADENAEPRIHPQAIEILPTFHADEHRFYVAGGNCIEQLGLHSVGNRKGRRVVTLILPEWWKK